MAQTDRENFVKRVEAALDIPSPCRACGCAYRLRVRETTLDGIRVEEEILCIKCGVTETIREFKVPHGP